LATREEPGTLRVLSIHAAALVLPVEEAIALFNPGTGFRGAAHRRVVIVLTGQRDGAEVAFRHEVRTLVALVWINARVKGLKRVAARLSGHALGEALQKS
jgi:hypothetical protein